MRCRNSQDGSIPLTLTVIILVGGVVAALVATVIGTQRSVTFDRNFSEAITGADAGLHQALTYLSTNEYSTLPATVDSTTLGLDNEIGQADFEWTATKSTLGGWDVRSSGQVSDQIRVIESSLQADQFFIVAAFGDLGVTLDGNNLAASYPDTGLGAVGSNNLITLRGNSTVVDLINLYGSNASCTGNPCADADTSGTDSPFDMEAIRAAVQAEHDDACSASDYTAKSVTSVGTPNGDGTYSIAAGTVICATNFAFDADLTISGADQDDPVKLLATQDVTSDNRRYVNCDASCDNDNRDDGSGNDPEPISGALRISTLGPSVRFGNQSEFAAAILAPNALCGGNPSAANTDIYGSLVCEELGGSGGNQGSWNFYFDVNLIDIGSGSLKIASYREEAEGVTSFD